MESTISEHLDCRGLKCPMPIVKISKAMKRLAPGERISIESDDPAFRADLDAWVRKLGYTMVEFEGEEVQRAVVEKTSQADSHEAASMEKACPATGVAPTLARLVDELVAKAVEEKWDDLQKRFTEIQTRPAPSVQRSCSDRATIVVFSGDMDRLFGAFIIATGAAAMGMEVSMFFTFWGLSAIKRKTVYKGKPITGKLMAAMLPSGPDSVGTSRMNMMGLGPAFFRKMMKKNKVESLPELIDQAVEMGVRLVACRMSMDVLGMKEEELIDSAEYGGVATYLGDASDSKISLFI